MKHFLLLVGAAAFSFSGPALAKPGGGGNPHATGMGSHLNTREMSMGGHVNAHAMGMHGGHIRANRMGIGFAGRHSGPVGFGHGGCPPGLAKKAVPCVPPGQARHQFAVGARIPTDIGTLVTFNALPPTVRTRFGTRLDRRSRFLMSNGSLVTVNPRTHVVENVIRIR